MKSEDTVVGLTEEGWDFVIGTDLKGVWLGMRAVIPSMIRSGGGRIVNISSIVALRGLTNLASYSAAKAGVISLTKQAALDYAPHNVLINAIAPGAIDTPIFENITEEMRKVNTNAHLIKRMGKPEEIAGTMAHFFSDDGKFFTGACFNVDGGWSASGRISEHHGLNPMMPPLPVGLRFRLDPTTRVERDGRTLWGGTGSSLVRLTDEGARELGLAQGPGPLGERGRRLGRRLVAAGLAYPLPPRPSDDSSVTIVIPVRDRASELDRCLAALGRSRDRGRRRLA